MATELEVLTVRLEANARNLERQMQRANGIIARSTKQMEQTTAASGARLTAILSTAGQKAGNGLMTGLAVLGAGGAVAGLGLVALVDTARQAAAELAKIGDVSDRIGVTAEALQALQFASEQNAGSAEAVNSGLQRFAQGLADASAGGGDLYKILQANGVAFQDVHGKLLPTEQVLMRFADLVQNARTPAEALELAVRAFGRSAGPELVGMLSQGSDGLREMMNQAKASGAVLDNELIKKAQEIDDRFAAIARTVSMNVKGAIISLFEPLAQFVAYVERGANALKLIGPNANRVDDAFNVDAHARSGGAAGGSLRGFEEQLAGKATPPLTLSVKPRATVLPASGDGGAGKAQAAAERLVESYRKLKEGALARISDLQAEQQALGLTAEAAETLRFKQELINRAQMAGIELSPAQRAEIEQLAQQYGTLATAVDQAAQAQQEMQALAKDVLGGFVSDLREGKSAADALSNAVDKIADKLIDMALNAAISGIFGGVGGTGGFLSSLFAGGRASGGPVQAGKTYMVGENGPEMVRFGRNGTVVPNSAVKAGRAGPTQVDNRRTYQIDARGAQAGVADQITAALRAYDRALPGRISDINMRMG